MIDGFRPYPAMKDSGVPWLGDVPEHWEVGRVGRLFVQRNEVGFGTLPILEVSLRTGVRVRAFGESDRKQTMSDREKYKRACKGDIAYNMMRMWQGAVGVAPCDGLISPAYVVARPVAGTISEYFSGLFRTTDFMAEVDRNSRGIVKDRNRLYWEDFKRIVVAYPAVDEQSAIVRFLNHVEADIRRYMTAKQKLIRLLEEEKQAIIHRAVTRGLNPNARLKPSGVPGLEDVPQHWGDAIRMKYISSLKGRLGWQGLKASEYVETGPYVVSSAHFKQHTIDWRLCPHVSMERYQADQNIQLTENDILLMKDGAAMGKLAFVDHLPDAACLNSHLLLFRPKVLNGEMTYDPKFMFYFLMCTPFQSYVQINGTGATFNGISQEAVGNYKICLPAMSEQREISAFIEEEVSALDKLLSLIGNQFERLHEYRIRLVSDVVTGKVDVRDVATKLPEAAQEAEPLDEVEDLPQDEESAEVEELEAEDAT